MSAYSSTERNKLWFGTEDRMVWFRTPNAGADTSPQGWNSEGVDLNGNGWSFSSFGSHKQYQYDWKGSSSRAVAQEMKSYADGTFGRGKIYFLDPTIYDLNVLPANWADPSMLIGYDGLTHVAGVQPSAGTSSSGALRPPLGTASFNLEAVTPGFRGRSEAVYVPIPDGFDLHVGAFYTAAGTGGVFASPSLGSGAVGDPVRLTAKTANDASITSDVFSNVRGVWLWIGKTSSVNSSVTVQALIAKVVRRGKGPTGTAWVGGMGHAGCRFVGKPTFIENGPDWTGFSATFKEVSN